MGCTDHIKSRRTRDVSGRLKPREPVSPPGSEGGQNLAPQALGAQRFKARGHGNASSQSANVDAVAEPSASTARRRKMASSQSPTQSNDGRSYEQYMRSSPGRKLVDDPDSAPPKPTQQESDQNDRAPQKDSEDDDSDVVRLDFDAVRSTDKTVSSLHTESSAIDFGPLSRVRDMASQQSPAFPHLPETPAPPQNPFRNSRSQLLAPSQLFGISSAVKQGSPTSSRPSPHDFHQANSISPNPPFVSSPLKDRGLRSTPVANFTSSPGTFPRTNSNDVDEPPSSPPGTTSSRTPAVPDFQSSRLRATAAPEPMSTYEPMRKSQERRSNSLARSPPESSEDEDDSIARKRKAKLRKEAALKKLTEISFVPPTKSDDVEVPSTNQRRRRKEAEGYLAQCHGSPSGVSGDEETVANSQTQRQAVVKETILPNEESTQSDAGDDAEPSSIPDTAPTMPMPRLSPGLVLTQRLDQGTSGDAIPETSPAMPREKNQGGNRQASSETPLKVAKSTANFKSSPPAFSTRSKKAHAHGSSSSLSNLATTPVVSASTTPLGDSSRIEESVEKAAFVPDLSPFPVQAKGKRRGAAGKLSRLSTRSTESLRVSARHNRRMSNSTDELSRSAATTPTFEQSLRMSRTSMTKSSRTSKANVSSRGPKLFEGMAFAISFQSRKPGETNDQYSTRMEFAGIIESRVKQAGGKVLDVGFDQLFDLPTGTSGGSPSGPSNLDQTMSLTEAGRATGFTALIADGHSRKVKYMQALALGLPCIAARWVTSCLDQGEITDWTPYLLCAGQSTFLGDAIRSRSLVPYDASTARLANVVDSRPKFLLGSRILLVVKKALEGKKMAYVFLARVLGASVTRVFSIEEAKAEAKAAEDAGNPFDWVYVDGKEDAGDLVAGTAAASSGGGKKRKRPSTTAQTAGEPAAKKIRTLSDELVIQSLILGRMIEDGEMEV